MKIPPGWTWQEPGWIIRDGVGGIVHERDDRWWGYPTDGTERIGPYVSARVAAQAMDARRGEKL